MVVLVARFAARDDSERLFPGSERIGIFLVLNGRIGYAGPPECGADSLLRDPFLKFESSDVAPDKIRPKHTLPAVEPPSHSDGNQEPGNDKCRLGKFHEIELGGANEVEHRH